MQPRREQISPRKERKERSLQGDNSACSKPPVDIAVKVAFFYKDLILHKTQLSNQCQREVLNKRNCHPIQNQYSEHEGSIRMRNGIGDGF